MRDVLDVLPSAMTLMAFSLVALGIVLSPGPNMMYLVSRSVAQGRRAGYVSLLGVAAGFLCYLLLTCLGLASVFVAVPRAGPRAGRFDRLSRRWPCVRPARRERRPGSLGPVDMDSPGGLG